MMAYCLLSGYLPFAAGRCEDPDCGWDTGDAECASCQSRLFLAICSGDVVFPEVVAATFPADPEGKGGGAGDLAAVGAVLRRELLRGLPGDCLAFPSSEGLARVEGPGGGFEAHITFIPERGGGGVRARGHMADLGPRRAGWDGRRQCPHAPAAGATQGRAGGGDERG